MKYTLLELTQSILSGMDGDEITSINDNVEAGQVVEVIRQTYFDILSRANLPENYILFGLEAGGVTAPVQMSMPTTIHELCWLKYDCQITDAVTPDWRTMKFMPVKDFMDMTQTYDVSDTANVSSYSQSTQDGETFTVYYRILQAPVYYTTWDDHTLIFDGYDSTVDTVGLTKAKSLAYGEKIWEWSSIDAFTPQLDDKQFSLLLNEAKSLAWAEMKQTVHAKAEKSARRGWATLGRTKHGVPSWRDNYQDLPNFGRK